MNEDIPRIDPRRSALLVMDYQSGIVDRVPDPVGLLARASTAIATARAAAMHVGYVRVAFDEADYALVPDTNKTFAVSANARLMRNDAPETAIHEAVAPEPGDIIVRKTRVGAFSTTDLDRRLGDRGIDTIVLAGISTSGVVLSTVRDGADRDYRIYVLSDGCADPDPEVHDFLIRRVYPRQTYVVTVDEMAKLLQPA